MRVAPCVKGSRIQIRVFSTLLVKEPVERLQRARGRIETASQRPLEIHVPRKGTFALRANDIESGRLRVDEALKQTERGSAFIGEPKTVDSYGYVSLPAKLETELRSVGSRRGDPA